MDELDNYLNDGVFRSEVGQYLVGVGYIPADTEGGYGNLNLLGLIYSHSDYWNEYRNRWDDFEEDNDDPIKLEAMVQLAEANEVPLLWFGDLDSNWRNNDGTIEVGVIERDGDGYDFRPDIITLSELEPYLQELFGTNLDEFGTGKEATKTIPLQYWGRSNLPKEYVTIDIDLLVLNEEFTPQAIGETKRTNEFSWTPHRREEPNYHLQAKICEGIGATPFIIKHQKRNISDDESVLFIEFSVEPGSDSWLDWEEEDYNIINASEIMEFVNGLR